MGMYDTVVFMCPNCHGMVEEQTKAGECTLKAYSLNNAPFPVIADIIEESNRGRLYCSNCSSRLSVNAQVYTSVTVEG